MILISEFIRPIYQADRLPGFHFEKPPICDLLSFSFQFPPGKLAQVKKTLDC